MAAYGVDADESAPLIAALERNPTRWRDFMMRFELGLEEPDPRRARRSAATIATAYLVGGLVPLSPYLIIDRVPSAFSASVVVTLAALLCIAGSVTVFSSVLFTATFSLDSPRSLLCGGLAFLGLGWGAFAAPNASIIFGAAPRNQLGAVSGVFATTGNIGTSVGISLASLLLGSWLTRQGVSVSSGNLRQVLSQAPAASIMAFRAAWATIAVAAFVAVPAAWVRD